MFLIPNSKEIIDLILSKTQRRTPTIVHRQFCIQKIRQFYMRKIKFFEQNLKFFIEKILKNFPLIDQLHPFFCDLLNILFNRNNYKIALNQLHKTKIKISKISENHLKLLKYGNSLYNCKQIKKIALGKMCKKIKKLNTCFLFLEKIRCQVKKIPKIDPHRKTILIGGYSGTGKSCLMNKLTRTNGSTKNIKNNTKFLFLGHLTNKFWIWQIIDTPGITHSDLNLLTSIEMQSLVALINLNYRILYLLDFNKGLKCQVQKQVKILIELRKLIKKKEKIFILSKTDLEWEKSINQKQKTIINFINNYDEKKESIIKASFHDEIGILEIRDQSFILRSNKILIKKKKIIPNLKKKKILFNQFSVQKKKTLKTEKRTHVKFLNSHKNIFKEKKDQPDEINFFREEKVRELKMEKNFIIRPIKKYFIFEKNQKSIKFFSKNEMNLKTGFNLKQKIVFEGRKNF